MNETPTADRRATGGWFKSSYSAAENECVEIAHIVARVRVRDSKVLGRGGFIVSTGAFVTFIDGLKDRSGIRTR